MWVNGPKEKSYAILSHTWNHGNELTFQEMQTGAGREKSGYTKIRGTCAQAAKDGHNYVWIDTVCINKESSAELTEAINSMWQWYCDAEVCYALLEDIHGSCPILKDIEDNWVTDSLNDPESHTIWPKKFASSRWFARGWTLQELLAPRNMIFFGCEWSEIGTKTSLLNRLHSVTEIEKLALEDRAAIRQFVIARRMCWAARRVTSRIEDRAYSLLGIFGVNMPMLYGEGEKAFIRLQEELIKSSTDHSILAWEWGTVRTIHDDLLFACSPDQFYPQGKNMIYWVGTMKDHSFTLTNRGIDFHLVSMKQKRDQDEPASVENGGAWLILNCRYEYDSSGIALQLVQKDDITTRMNSLTFAGNEAYWVASRPGESRLHIWKKYYPRSHRCLLLRHHIATTWNAELPPKFRICLYKDAARSFTVLSGWPNRLWRNGSDILCLPPQKTYPDTVIASASIGMKGTMKVPFIHVAISFQPIVREGNHMPKLALSRASQEEARIQLSSEETSNESSEVRRMEKIGCDRQSRSPKNDKATGANDGAEDLIASAQLRATDAGDLAVLAIIANNHRVPENAVYNVEVFWAESEAAARAKHGRSRQRMRQSRTDYSHWEPGGQKTSPSSGDSDFDDRGVRGYGNYY